MTLRKKEQRVIRMAGVIVILLLVGVLLVRADVLPFALPGGGDYIERPIFKYVKCEPMSSLVTVGPYIVRDDQAHKGGFDIPRPLVTNKYSVRCGIPPSSFLFGRKVSVAICNSKVLDPSNCEYMGGSSVLQGDKLTINNIKNGQYVYLQITTTSGTKLKGDSICYLDFIPYGLREYDTLSGSSNPVNPNSCAISFNHDSWKDRFISTDADRIDDIISKSTNELTLQPEEVRWYVSGYVTGAAPSFTLRYKGKDAWCRSTGTSGEIYAINTIEVGSGTYKIASPDYSDYLGSETCCPSSTRGDEVCNSNFQWEKIQGGECGPFKSCGPPNWVPYSTEQIIRYSCVDGFCEKEIRSVECASNFDCRSTNEICDLNTWTCVDPDVNLDGDETEIIPDNEDDCEEKGGVWITETTERKRFLNYFGIGEPEIVVIEYCDMGQTGVGLMTIILIIGGGVILVLLTAITVTLIVRRGKPKRRK